MQFLQLLGLLVILSVTQPNCHVLPVFAVHPSETSYLLAALEVPQVPEREEIYKLTDSTTQ